MRSNATAKTKSALRWILVTALPVIASFAAGWFLWQALFPTTTVNLNGRTYSVTVADNSQAQAKGLSGREDISADEGMLFKYQRLDKLCFWMKDMNFPIDIVWIDPLGKVVKIERNVLPETYPTKYCADAQYALELKAGESETAGLKVGQTIEL